MAHQRVVLSPGAALLRQARSRDASHVARDDPNSSSGACVLLPPVGVPKACPGQASLFMLLWSQAFYCCASCSDLTLLHLQALVNLPGQDRQSQHSSSASRPHTPPMTDHMSAGRGWLAMRAIGPAGLAAWQKVF